MEGGGPVYAKPLVSVAEVLSGLVTTTVAAPNGPGGVIALISVPLLTTTEAADWPAKVTPAPNSNPLPVMVTEVPPLVRPLFGVMPVNVGGDPAITVNVPLFAVRL